MSQPQSAREADLTAFFEFIMEVFVDRYGHISIDPPAGIFTEEYVVDAYLRSDKS